VRSEAEPLGHRIIPLHEALYGRHKHLLKDFSISEFLAKINANSNRRMRKKHCPEFNWQDGYAAYSVSKSNLEVVRNYIQNQDEHHHHTIVIEEFEARLKKHWKPEDLCRP
jgi:putative transposase